MKTYSFTYLQLVVLREALADYKQHLKSGTEPTPGRQRNIDTATALHEQFKDDVRLYKGNV